MQVSITGPYTCLSRYEVNIGSSLYAVTLFKFLKDTTSQRIRKIIMKDNEKIMKMTEMLFSKTKIKLKRKARHIDGVKQVLNLTTLWSHLSLFPLSQKYCL